MDLICVTDETKQRLFVHGSTTRSSRFGAACYTRYVTEENNFIHGQ